MQSQNKKENFLKEREELREIITGIFQQKWTNIILNNDSAVHESKMALCFSLNTMQGKVRENEVGERE